MSMPTGFGEFWPEGDFEYDAKVRDSGWRSRLKEFYEAQTPDEQTALFGYDDANGNAAHLYGGYVIAKFSSELGTRGSREYPPYGPIKDHEIPRSFRIQKAPKSLGSMVALNYGIWAVDDNLRYVIERVDPEAHQFFRISLFTSRRAAEPTLYNIMVIGRYLDSFSPEQTSGYSLEKGDAEEFVYSQTKAGISNLALSRTKSQGAPLWRERKLSPLLTCMSDELEAEIVSAGLSIPKHFKMREF